MHNIYVGVTNDNWYSFLAATSPVELNFWKPGGTSFKALKPGEPFLFKLHHPKNYIAGGGYFAGFTRMTVAEAWDTFHEQNGARDFVTLCRMLRIPESIESEAVRDKVIGCVVLVEPFFFEPGDWIPIPKDWGKNIVQGKIYHSSEAGGNALWEEVLERLQRCRMGWKMPDRVRESQSPYPASSSEARFGTPFLTRARLGQAAFRLTVSRVYKDKCAITGESVTEVLQAVHIRPYAQDGSHMIQNALLLRADLHALFDCGLITITPEYTVLVSHRLRKRTKENPSYCKLHGCSLAVLPDSKADYPEKRFLEWHNKEVYRP